MPVNESELPILESLVGIRVRLTALKKDRTEYIRAQDVFELYREVIKQVIRLNEVREHNEAAKAEDAALLAATAAAAGRKHGQRAGTPSMGESSSSKGYHNGSHQTNTDDREHQLETNRVDTTLADVFQLLSLFFLTIGKSRSAPATYCQLAAMQKLLDHMKESGVYTKNDLQPFKNRLAELKSNILAEIDYQTVEDQSGDAPHPPQPGQSDPSLVREDPIAHAALTKLLLKRYDKCHNRLKELLNSLTTICVDLVPLHQRLVTLRRQLIALGAKGLKVNKTELDHVADELRKIEQDRVDGKFIVDDEAPEQGQAILSGLLEETFDILQEIHSREEEVSPQLKPIFDRLTEMRAQLEKLTLTHRWTLRETDLYNFQVSLQEIDRMRVNGKFVDADGNKPHGQRVLLYNLRRCYGLIYRLMSSSEPISEELMPLANKLATVTRCLNEVLKFGGPFSARDLYPYQLALAQIENKRIDGKFIGRDGTLPEGQAILNANLSESYEMMQLLKEEMEQD